MPPYITALFTNNGTPETGLTPDIEIYRLSDDVKVVDTTMSEIGAGLYKYDFSTYDEDEDYVFLLDGGATINTGERYQSGTLQALGDILKTPGRVWDILLADHNTAGSMGQAQNRLDDINAKTDLLPADPASETNATSNKNEILSDTGDIITAVDTIDGLVDAIKLQTDKMQFTGLDHILSDTQNTDDIASEVWDTDADLHEVAGTFGEEIDILREDIVTLDGLIDAIKSQTDKFNFDGSDNVQARVNDAGVLENPSAGDIADEVWDDDLTARTITNSPGRLLRAMRGLIASYKTLQGSTNDTATLNIFESNDDDHFNEMILVVNTSAIGWQARRIEDYDGGSKIATIYRNWEVNPSSGDEYIILSSDVTSINAEQVASIVDAVWDESAGAHVSAGSTGETLVNAGEDAEAVRDFLNLTIEPDLNAVKAKTDNLPADPASETNATSNKNEIISETDDIDTELSNVASSVDVVDTVVDSIKAKTDNLPADPTSETNATSNKNEILTGIGDIDIDEDAIADAVWEEPSTDHLTAGTMGREQNRENLNYRFVIPSVIDIFAVGDSDLNFVYSIWDGTGRITLNAGMVTNAGTLTIARFRGGRLAVETIIAPVATATNGTIEMVFTLEFGSYDLLPGDSLILLYENLELEVEGITRKPPSSYSLIACRGGEIAGQGSLVEVVSDTEFRISTSVFEDNVWKDLQVLFEYTNPFPNTQNFLQARNVVSSTSDTIVIDEPLDFTPDIDSQVIILARKASGGIDQRRMLGLLHQNIVVEHDWDGQNHVGSTLYLYDSKTNADNHDKSTGLIEEYTLENQYNGDDLIDLHRVTKEE